MDKLKEEPILSIISLVCIILGLLLLVIPSSHIMLLVFTVIGIGTIVKGIYDLASYFVSIQNGDENNFTYLFMGILWVVIGILLITGWLRILLLILGLVLITLQLFRIFNSPNRQIQFFEELPNIVFASILIILGVNFLTAIVIKLIGIILIGLSIFLLYMILTSNVNNIGFLTAKILNKTRRKKPNRSKDDDYIVG